MNVILLIRNKHYQQLPLLQYRERRMDYYIKYYTDICYLITRFNSLQRDG